MNKPTEKVQQNVKTTGDKTGRRMRSRRHRRRKRNLSINDIFNELLGQGSLDPKETGCCKYNRHQAGFAERQTVRAMGEDDSYISTEDLCDDDLVYWFMTKGGNESARIHQADLVGSFCHPKTFQELQLGSPEVSLRKTCLLNEPTKYSSVSHSLRGCKPLTIGEMYLKLSQKRSFEHSSAGVLEKPSANRRQIFITNPDSHGLVALMATASGNQIDSMIDFLYSYVAFKSHIGIKFKPAGLAAFALSFHLPFYSWQPARYKPEDLRLSRDGSPLRQVYSMNFLKGNNKTSTPEADYLCQAQVSVYISRLDNRVWTGYCFVDTYHQPGDRMQHVEDYCSGDILLDPFTNGNHDAGRPILDPDEYFVTCLECHLKVFKSEWVNTVEKFKQKVEHYLDEYEFAYGNPDLSAYQGSRQSLAWLRQTGRRLSQLIVCLKNTIECWDNFACQYRFRTIYGRQSLLAIQQSFAEVRNCLTDLYNVRTLCNEHKKALSLHHMDEQHRLDHLQSQVAEKSQLLSYFLLYVLSPITLAAAMLSMQEKAIPGFLGPTRFSFFILTPILVLLVALASKTMHSWEQIQLYVHETLKRRQERERRSCEV